MLKNKLNLIFLFFLSASLYAQNDSMLLIHSYKADLGVRLKWLPASAKQLALGTKSGYNLYKAPVLESGGKEVLGQYTKINEQPIKPWTESKFKEKIASDSNFALIQGYVNYSEIYLNRKTPANPKEAVENNEDESYFSFFASLSVLQSNENAAAMGLYFIDKTPNTYKKYMYKLELIGNKNYTDYLLCNPLKISTANPIANFTATNKPKRILLKWYNNNNADYVAYNIYQSDKKNGTFKKLNDIPFINSGGPAATDQNYCYYYDSIAEYGKTVYYKVQGIDAFGELGQATEIQEVKTNYLLEYGASVNDGQDLGIKGVKLSWSYNQEELPYVKSFDIYRADNASGPFKKINDKILNNKQNEYLDNSEKTSSNYYIIYSYGVSGDSIASIIKSILLIDSIPPAKPIIDTITCDTNGVVTICWKKNKEKDLNGYRIFKTYDRSIDAFRINQELVSDTTLTDTVDLSFDFSKIFYRVYALDYHFNPSDPSTYYDLILPDKNPPTTPFFTTYNTNMQGIVLKWQKSNSQDLAKTVLYRKSELDFKYYPIREFEADSLVIMSYLDTNVKARTRYAYVLQSVDISGLKSEMSPELNVQMLDNAKIPRPTNLEGMASKENRMIKLTWELDANAKGYKLYRAENGEQLLSYTYISGNVREYYDKTLKPNTQYTYVLVAELPNNIKSGYSNKLIIKY